MVSLCTLASDTGTEYNSFFGALPVVPVVWSQALKNAGRQWKSQLLNFPRRPSGTGTKSYNGNGSDSYSVATEYCSTRYALCQ